MLVRSSRRYHALRRYRCSNDSSEVEVTSGQVTGPLTRGCQGTEHSSRGTAPSIRLTVVDLDKRARQMFVIL